ncbi:MAG TPA: hypothetical protein PLS66_12155 [Tepiditoga sp.]|mgnify:CR=1 FL=1|nr:hypothetical protein [Thermotogota bacterium]HOO76039.1 hypothetical protein [Tepiditoga sp.]
MLKLNHHALELVKKNFQEIARPLELNIYNMLFEGGSEEDAIQELLKYQNSDGGFGNGIEPDFLMPYSSPAATTKALEYLEYFSSEKSEDIRLKVFSYLEKTFDKNENRWFSITPEVNNFPHAPWWEFIEEKNMSVIDFNKGNPSAEILSYIYKYNNPIKSINTDEIIKFYSDYLNSMKKFQSDHEIYCFLRLYNVVNDDVKKSMKKPLKKAINSLVSKNNEDWINYVPEPLKFVSLVDGENFGLEKRLVDQNINYRIGVLELYGIFTPNWSWDNYEEDWEISKKAWSGILTLENLILLKKYGRI